MNALATLTLVGAAWLLTACAPGGGPAELVPRVAAGMARGEQCVAETGVMRRTHMDLLKHQRDETVHRGVRDPKSSLKGCIECHASPTTGSVAQAADDFCVRCHSVAAVKVDCFECHASKPPSTSAFLPLRHPHPATTAGTGAGDGRLLAQWRQALMQGLTP